jgi:3-methyladenine DNA glycosylase AlkD
MLREVGKKDEEILKKFLVDNIDNLPRTTLRYAIERFPTTERKKFLNM